MDFRFVYFNYILLLLVLIFVSDRVLFVIKLVIFLSFICIVGLELLYLHLFGENLDFYFTNHDPIFNGWILFLSSFKIIGKLVY